MTTNVNSVNICFLNYFIAVEVVPCFTKQRANEGVMTLRASNQVLSNVWSFQFYDMTLSDK